VFSIVFVGISLLDEVNLCVAWIDNQQSSGVVTARSQSSIWSLRHQRRDLHQSTYLYLSEDQEFTALIKWCQISSCP
jgi:hypothetical protein